MLSKKIPGSFSYLLGSSTVSKLFSMKKYKLTYLKNISNCIEIKTKLI